MPRMAALLFLSGASSLAYEIAWTRWLGGVFGVALHATTAVLVAYMAGLSLGGVVGGRVAPRLRAPLRVYAALEVAIAGAALLVPLGLSAIGGLYGLLYEPLLERPALGFAVRFLGSLVILLVPTTLMGATLPIAAQASLREAGGIGAGAGLLYAANTAGAVVGVAATGLWVLPALGVSLSNQLAAAVSALVALLALVLGGRGAAGEQSGAAKQAAQIEAAQHTQIETTQIETAQHAQIEAAQLGAAQHAQIEPLREGHGARGAEHDGPGGPPTDAAAEGPRLARGAPIRATLLLAGLSGFVALGYEIVWTHVLAAVTRDTTFAFTCTLAAFLAGIALGGWTGARVSGHVHAALGLAVCQAGVALSGLLGFVAMRWPGATGTSPSSFSAAMAQQLAAAATPMLLPTLLLGASLPLCLDLAGRAHEGHAAAGSGRAREGRAAAGSGRAVGDVLAANTLGAVLGCVLTGLCLVPGFGFGKSAVLLSTVALAGALGALRLGASSAGDGRARPLFVRDSGDSPPNSRRRPGEGPVARRTWERLALGAIAVELLVVLPAASTDWFFPDRGAGGQIVLHAEDASGIVEVTEQEGVRTLITDRRHRWGSTHPRMIDSMHRQGALPLLLHPRPAQIVEIGLATGIHALPQLRDSRVERLTIVEISPAIVDAASAFAAHNGGLLNDPRVDVVLDDGRSFLQRTTRRFDVIVLGLFVPYRPGAGALYGRELLAACRERSLPGGLVIEWLPLDQMPLDAVRSVMATFLDVFPHVEAWERGHYLALVGTSEPHRLDAADVRARLRALGGAEVTGLRDAEDLLASHFLGPAEVRALAAGAPLNTEDRPRVEFMHEPEERGGLGYGRAAHNLERLLAYRAERQDVAAWPDANREPAKRRFLSRGHSLRGAVLQARGQHRAAYAAFLQALAIDPEEEIAKGEVARYAEALRRARR